MCLGAQADSEAEARLWGSAEARCKGRAEPRGLPGPGHPLHVVTHPTDSVHSCWEAGRRCRRLAWTEGWLPGGAGLAVLKPGLHPAGRVESRDWGQEGQISSERGAGGGNIRFG